MGRPPRCAADAQTRLVVTGTARGESHAVIAVGNWLGWDPAHWVMRVKQFAELRRRAEATTAQPPEPSPE